MPGITYFFPTIFMGFFSCHISTFFALDLVLILKYWLYDISFVNPLNMSCAILSLGDKG